MTSVFPAGGGLEAEWVQLVQVSSLSPLSTQTYWLWLNIPISNMINQSINHIAPFRDVTIYFESIEINLNYMIGPFHWDVSCNKPLSRWRKHCSDFALKCFDRQVVTHGFQSSQWADGKQLQLQQKDQEAIASMSEKLSQRGGRDKRVSFHTSLALDCQMLQTPALRRKISLFSYLQKKHYFAVCRVYNLANCCKFISITHRWKQSCYSPGSGEGSGVNIAYAYSKNQKINRPVGSRHIIPAWLTLEPLFQ